MRKSGVSKYLSLVKFSHTLFALPFAITGYVLAITKYPYAFDWKVFIPIILCMVFARTAAMAFNRYLDREIDKKNLRTSQREIPAGLISDSSALVFVIINAILFVASSYSINMLVFYLSPIALLVILGYSYTKKFTSLCHFVLGLGLSLAPIGAFLSVTSYFAIMPILLSLIVLFWTGGFDIIYSLQDVDFDRNEKLHSIPSTIGVKKALIVSKMVHVFAVVLVAILGWLGNFGILYLIGSFIFSILLLMQHVIIARYGIKKVNLAFFTSNSLASSFFCIFVIIDLITSQT